MGAPASQNWVEGMRDLEIFAKQNPQTAYTGLGMLLQLKSQYLQKNVPGVGALMEKIELAIREDFFPHSLDERIWMMTS